MSDRTTDPPALSHVWVMCGTCWGQRRLLSAAPAGGLAARVCPDCMGLGERLTEPARP